jgi:hypothetical protein
MTSLFAAVLSLALMLAQPQGMQPRVLLGSPHRSPCDALTVRDGHIVVEANVCVSPRTEMNPRGVKVTWDGFESTITPDDEKASAEWMEAHSLLLRLSIKRGNLYWDGKKVELGKVKVIAIYQAIPWQGGVLIYGRTVPRRGFFGSWPFKGPLIDARDIEPYCAIYFNPTTLKGEDRYLNGKVERPFFVFPIPR